MASDIQYLFGVVGPVSSADMLLAQLTAATVESNPRARPEFVNGGSLRLGCHSRAFASWQGGDLRLFLDGEILFIHGTPTVDRGHAPGELERIAQLYRLYGAGLWERLDGNFCLLIEDGPVVRIGVDLTGHRTLYYWQRDDVLAFHSHLLDLAQLYPGPLTENMPSISMFLTSGANLAGETAYREIRHLGPGSHLCFVNGTLRQERHFRLVFTPRRQASLDELVPELHAVLGEAVATSWRASRNPVLPLSGGADSRYIVAELARQVDDRTTLRTITWGTARHRPNSDAQVAARVAQTLGIENVWHEKTHDHLDQVFARTIYLSSGEADTAIHYPDDPLLHKALADTWHFSSMFRGETTFRRYQPLLTPHAILAENDMLRLLPDSGYRALLGDALFDTLLMANREAVNGILGDLRSATPGGKRDELYYSYRIGQILSPGNRVKHAHLEIYNPLISRKVLDWISSVPDNLRQKRVLFMETLRRFYPDVMEVPLATASNLPSWRSRFASEPALARFYADWCKKPGWLAGIGAQEQVVAAWQAIGVATGQDDMSSRYTNKSTWKNVLKQTLPGRLLRELTLDRRSAASLPGYLMLARLAVLHGLLGHIQARRAKLASQSVRAASTSNPHAVA